MKKVSIKFINKQIGGGMTDTEKHNYIGTLRVDSNFWVLTYSENPTTKVALRIMQDGSSVKTDRFSECSNTILVEKGKTTSSIYRTIAGSMQFDFKADQISISSYKTGITFCFSYYILQNGQIINHCDIMIECKYL